MARQNPPTEDHATSPPAAADPALTRSERRNAKRAVVEGRVELAQRLLDLPEEALATLDLDEELLDELRLARRLKRSGAKNRQVRYLAKLLVDDVDRLEALLDGIADGSIPIETPATRWAEQLLDEGAPAVEALLAECPLADRARLHRLIRQEDAELLVAYLAELDLP